MRILRWAIGVLGVGLLVWAVWQIRGATRGLEVSRLPASSPPLTFVAPRGIQVSSRPLVLIGHGFAGSQVIMRGFAYTLARAGYAVLLWDFRGHGGNPQPMSEESGQDTLLTDAEAALAEATLRGWGDPGRVAILGHSMGSGVALSFGQKHPETAATIAVSPVGQSVTPLLPRNLLLMAGSREVRFVENAEQRLAEAGGAGGEPATGTGRRLVVVPGVEHLSILFSPVAHSAARDWLDAVFGRQPGAVAYTDRRVLWYGLGVLGGSLVAVAAAGALARKLPVAGARRSLRRRLAALAGGALMSTLVFWLIGQAGVQLSSLLGLLVGGYLLLWFGLAGLVSLALLWVRPTRPPARAWWGALLALAALWLGVGLLGQQVWLPWWLVARRLVLWPLGSVLLLPWFLAVTEAMRGSGKGGVLGWWLATAVLVVGSMMLAMRLSPELGFLILILPLFPISLGLQALVAYPYRGGWAFALSGALFTSWLVLAVFPLQ